MSETAEQSGPDLEQTPTPWEVERHTNGVIFITALHSRGGDIADLYHVHTPNHGEPAIVQKDNALANAALIVTAVNALEPMKAALELARNALADMGQQDTDNYPTFQAVVAALALAEGKTEGEKE